MSEIKHFFNKAISLLTPPINNEFPFLVLFFLLISLSPIKYLIGGLISAGHMDPIVYIHMCRAIAISYLLTCIVYYSHNKWVKVLFYALGCTLFGVNVFLWLVFHKIIDPSIVNPIIETNKQEASEFFQTFLFNKKGIISVTIICFTIIVICFIDRHKKQLRSKFLSHRLLYKTVDIVVILLSVVGICNFRIYKSIFSTSTTDQMGIGDPMPYDSFTASLFSIQSVRLAKNEIQNTVLLTEKCKPGYIENKDSLNIILIIGESYIKKHAAIYGYYLPTTPNMTKEMNSGNLFPFNNVIAPYAGTSAVIKNVLECNSIALGESWYKAIYFPTILRKSMFNVSFWDNQRDDFTKGVDTYTLDALLYNQQLSHVTYNATNKKSFKYDDELIKDYESKKSLAKYNFHIFHLWGQHVDASERYPHGQFSRFSAKDIRNNAPYMTESKKQDVANYDNATYYNDYVINHIINLYRDKNTVVVYFSDHGEEIYDYRDSKGRVEAAAGQEKNWLKYQFEVPFVIWCSDKYKALHPDIIRRIKASLNRPFMTDNTCHLLFDLAGLKTIYYRPERDLISRKFKPSRRIVNNNTDFDAAMRK